MPDHFVVIGDRHLRYLVGEFLDYYPQARPHQSLGNRPLNMPADHEPPADGEIVCQERLGGLLKHYYRKAA